MFQRPSRTILAPTSILLLTLLCWLAEPFSSEYLAFQRQQITDYYWWQFVTANIVHTNFTHLLLNAMGIALLWIIHGRYFSVKGYWLTCLALGLGVTFGILIFSPHLNWYSGFSGILHGLFVIGACKDIVARVALSWILFIAVWLKIIYEQVFGQSDLVASLIDANVAIDAHLYGAVVGLLIFIAVRIISGPKKKASS